MAVGLRLAGCGVDRLSVVGSGRFGFAGDLVVVLLIVLTVRFFAVVLDVTVFGCYGAFALLFDVVGCYGVAVVLLGFGLLRGWYVVIVLVVGLLGIVF